MVWNRRLDIPADRIGYTPIRLRRFYRVRRILTRIRFRAANFGQIDFSGENKSRSCTSKQPPCAKSDPEIVFGSFLFLCSWPSSYVFGLKKIHANVDYCCVWRREETRRVHFARPRTQASEPPLTDSSLAAKRRTVELHVVFSSTKHPRPAR